MSSWRSHWHLRFVEDVDPKRCGLTLNVRSTSILEPVFRFICYRIFWCICHESWYKYLSHHRHARRIVNLVVYWTIQLVLSFDLDRSTFDFQHYDLGEYWSECKRLYQDEDCYWYFTCCSIWGSRLSNVWRKSTCWWWNCLLCLHIMRNVSKMAFDPDTLRFAEIYM